MIQPQIPKSTATIDGKWSIQIKALLCSQENLDVAENGYNEPEDATVEVALQNANKSTLKDSRKKEKKASFITFQGVDESAFKKISEETTTNNR